MQSLLSPHGVYAPADVDAALARVFGAGVRPLRFEEALCEAMLAGWRSQQAARYLKPKTVAANEATVRAFIAGAEAWPWEWRATHAVEFFEDLLARPQRLARSTLRAYQQRLRGFSEFACDRRYPWVAICEREFGRGPGQLFDERNRVAHLDEFEGDPRRRPLTVDELEAFFAASEARIALAKRRGRKGSLQAWRDQAMFKVCFGWGLRRAELAMLDRTDFPGIASAAGVRRLRAVARASRQSKRGGAPQRRTVLTVFDWAVDVVEQYVTEIRPRF